MKTEHFVWECTQCDWAEYDDPNIYKECPQCGTKVRKLQVYECDYCHQNLNGKEAYDLHRTERHYLGDPRNGQMENNLLKRLGLWQQHLNRVQQDYGFQILRGREEGHEIILGNPLGEQEFGKADLKYHLQRLMDQMYTDGKMTWTLGKNGNRHATILKSYGIYEEFITRAVVYVGLYRYFLAPLQALQASGEKLRRIKAQNFIYDKQVYVIPRGDLRLGRNHRFPIMDEAPYLVDEPVQMVETVIEELLGEVHFKDEAVAVCRHCGELIDMDPILGRPDYVTRGPETGSKRHYHVSCIQKLPKKHRLQYLAETQEQCKNRAVSLPVSMEGDLIILDHKFEYGVYGGQKDSPDRIIASFNAQGIDVWFIVYPRQWSTTFEVLVRSEDEEKAYQVLEDPRASELDYDPAEMLRRGLRGEGEFTQRPSSSPNASILFRQITINNPPKITQQLLTVEEAVSGMGFRANGG